MANKRMFSLTIVDTDAFMDMPKSSQLLYFHLAMRADDEGFVSSPKTIMRMFGCQDDDYKILVGKKFVIPFESGVCVIKHWLVHNTIRMDRFSGTTYIKEKSQLVIKDNKVYKLVNMVENESEGSWQPNGNQLATQVKLSKDNIIEDKLENSLSFLEKVPEETEKEFSEKFKCTMLEVAQKGWTLRDYCIAKGKTYKNYKALLSNALRKDYGERPPKVKVPIFDTSTGVARIIGYK